MSAASCLLSEDQFLCSICLEVFTDPVSTPCGHNFCKNCITQHWNSSPLCQCPVCKRKYCIRPELHVNTFISEMAAQFKLSAQQEASSSSSSTRRSEQQSAKPGEVLCDVCTGTKLKALKSCLVCLTTYCETHLQPHQTVSGLKRHQLIDPVKSLEWMICSKHDKPLELYCKTDQRCVCAICSVSNHKCHDVVPLTEEYEAKKAGFEKTEAEIQEMIQKRKIKIGEMKHSVQLSKKEADRVTAEGVQIFTSLIEFAKSSMKALIKTIEEQQRTAEKQAEGRIKELKQEISELMQRSSEVEQLTRPEDILHLIQSLSSVKAAPPTKDWTNISVHLPSYTWMVVRIINQVERNLRSEIRKVTRAELKRVRDYKVKVTFDADSVQPKAPQSANDNCKCVLSKQGFSFGRFYFELKVKTHSTWTVGVAKYMSNLKREKTKLSPENGYWTICSEQWKSGHPALNSEIEEVGVFIDYDEGLVCFYEINGAALIHSFIGCSFTEKLYPFFSTCRNDGVQIHTSACVIS
ncbi:zinc finger protein RFP-like [Maylandia zebra]|uniref:zinc finger protein RFP-like n=1 Tax=Maylandia zebra TaxID=106582 RepID=UPI0003298284